MRNTFGISVRSSNEARKKNDNVAVQMDPKILDNYFHDQCSDQELDQVLQWFETEEGRAFLEQDIDRQKQRFANQESRFLYPPVESERLFSRIQLHKNQAPRRGRRFTLRVASILLMAVVVSALVYWANTALVTNNNPKRGLITYATAPGQQKVFRLSDGTKIRLNEESTLILPENTSGGKRIVSLTGEAYFEVTHDPDHPFVVKTSGAAIEDLGTKFNVKTDSVARNVQVAVMEGKVVLKKDGEDGVKAFLSKNSLGILRLPDNQVTIEQANVKNYLSWVNGRLVFHGESLLQISRQLERLYDVNIQFKTGRLKKLHLTANFEKANLNQVLMIISRTLDIHFKVKGTQVLWTE